MQNTLEKRGKNIYFWVIKLHFLPTPFSHRVCDCSEKNKFQMREGGLGGNFLIAQYIPLSKYNMDIGQAFFGIL